ncbi:MAG: bifunctional metallophosphatase/5'-nucleotidase [Clostridia bacterium]|nr:bifunctional metallophosphatase/5'-nucleotidase [Clostridia bacterium]
MKHFWKKTVSLSLVFLLLLLSACSASEDTPADQPAEENLTEETGDVMILFTSDVHCGIDDGFGYAGLQQIRDTLEAQGISTLLVDDGDSIQGGVIGTVTKGEAILELMNAMHYDVAIPGNHEFDYGVDRFLELAQKAEFSYISCNFNREGELVFAPYVIKTVGTLKIAFVGVTTPNTITSSTPRFFQNEAGEYIYDFLRDDSGTLLYEAVQSAVDSVRAEGADYVYVIGHMGLASTDSPWTYADVISNTNGIDVFLDGHSHDTEQVVMKNKDGDSVTRSACGTMLNCIGYSLISPEKGIVDTGIWSWPNSANARELFGIQNEISAKIDAAMEELNQTLKTVVATTAVDLTISDPVETDTSGNPIRMIRRAETNLGDLCADAFRAKTGADIAVINGGGIRTSIPKGSITYEDINTVFPFGNMLSVVEVTGQQILDALEWTSRSVPLENGGFLQVSGMSYEIHLSANGTCKTDETGMCTGFEGERRVKNVRIGGEPLDPEKKYTLAGTDYVLLQNGDGMTAFDGAAILQDSAVIDNQVLIDYLVDTLGGEVGSSYADPYGEGRITIFEP